MNPIKFLDLRPSGHLADELIRAFDRVAGSGQYIGGKEVDAFEAEWAEYCGARYCVGVGNGHDALELAVRYYAEQKHDPVQTLTPWKTCLPTWAAIANGGGTPVPHKHQMHLLAVAVHIYGAITLPDVTPDIPIIEDCAQAHGASLGGVKAGKFGTVAAWSFYPTKNLGALGDAGAITTDDEEIADTVRRLAKYGTPNRPGINSRLDPLQAAFLRVKMPYLDGWNARRAENAAAYLETIDNAMIELPAVDAESKPAWHIFAIEVNDRDELAEYLRDCGVETMVHYPNLPYPSDRFRVPGAEWWAQSTISLPVAPHVTPEQCRYIGELVNTWATLKQFS